MRPVHENDETQEEGLLRASGVGMNSSTETTSELSVVVRTVSRNERLEENLASLRAQRGCRLQIVLVDMSNGAAGPVASRHLRDADIHLETGGKVLNRATALNAGIRAASARHLAILDDDNCWAPDQAATLVRLLNRGKADLAYTGVTRRCYSPDGLLLDERLFFQSFDYARLLWRNFIYTSATAFSKEAWQRAGRFDARFPVYEDWEFLIRLAQGAVVATEESHGAISRNFNGKPGIPEHHRESADCARCLEGLHWKHRRLLREKEAEIAEKYRAVKKTRHWRDWVTLWGWYWRGQIAVKSRHHS